jgi:hypothetical protein
MLISVGANKILPLQGILLVVVNIGVLLTSPIQFIMEKAAELIEAKAELAVFAAASALRVRQSAEVVHTRSRQILGRDLWQLSTVNDKHLEELKNLSSRDVASLRARLTSSVSISPTGMRKACSRIDGPAGGPANPQPPPPGDNVPAMRPKLRGQQFDDLGNIPSSGTSVITV